MKKTRIIKLACLLAMGIVIIMSGCTNSKSSGEKVPDIVNVVLKDANNVEISSDDGWIKLQPTTRINVKFDGDVDYIFLYFTPSGTDTFAQRELIGVLSAYDNDSTGEKGFGAGSTSAEYVWTVPDKSLMGHLGVELISETVARYESSIINIMNTSETNNASD